MLKLRFSRTVLSILASPTFLVTGCSQPNAPSNPSNRSMPAPSSKKTSHRDGTISSMKLLKYPGQNPGIDIYEMVYWSQGQRVSALLAEPAHPGKYIYPLYVYCHGGRDYPVTGDQHAADGVADSVEDSDPNLVTLYPEYSGYGDSQGSVKGLSSNALDVENAITAASSLPNVRFTDLDVRGVSMGGAVALMVSASVLYRQQIATVVAVSPFPGFEVAGAWDKLNANSNVLGAAHQRQVMVNRSYVYGTFSPNSKAYADESPVLANIEAPVLLVQGTKDTHVPWQMVQLLYQDMKRAGDNVTLDVVHGGDHGLTGRYTKVMNQDINNWRQSIGE